MYAIRSYYAAVVLAGADVGEVDVPDVAVDLLDLDAGLVLAVGGTRAAQEAQLDTLGDARAPVTTLRWPGAPIFRSRLPRSSRASPPDRLV